MDKQKEALENAYETITPKRVKKVVKKNRKFILYTIIGGGAVLLDVGIFWVLTSLTPLHVLVANTISIFTAMLYSFALNAKYNFKVNDRLFRRFISFIVVTGIGYSTSTLLLFTLSELGGLDPLVVKIASLPIILLIQFGLNSFFTFKEVSNVKE